jgi:hypothetical protein
MKRTVEFSVLFMLLAALSVGVPAGVGALADDQVTTGSIGGEPAAEDLSGQILSEEERSEYARRMELTPEQIAQVEPILDSAALARRDALEHYGVNFETNERPGLFSLIKLKLAIDDINRKAEELLRPHLSWSQMLTYKRILAEREAEMRDRLMAMN